ncbi:ATP-binding cassette sub- G member 2, partial [Kappamyces sp. JEL0680]
MLAIIGSSGSGKSTLLDTLAGRKEPRGVQGQFYLNGHPVSSDFISTHPRVSYVMQDDAFLPNLSCLETLRFAYALKRNISYAEVPEAEIRSILQQLRLSHVETSLVGSPLQRGISGGERRRLSIGVELVTSPTLLFLDEPTSGLDSVNAIRVVETIKNLCKPSVIQPEGCTAVMSIHQPSSTLFQLFDNLMVLDHGRVVYFGPAAESVSYFSSIGFQCQPFTNPAEYFLDIVLRDSDELDPGTSDTKVVQIRQVEDE